MITRLRGGQEIQLRAFSLTNMIPYGWSDLPGLSNVREGDMRGLPAINRAARLRAEAVASLRLYCWSGEGVDRVKRTQVWQAKLFDKAEYNEYQTRFTFWETVGESLAYRNNAYIWKNLDPLSGLVVELFALNPDQVTCKGENYEIEVMEGFVDPVGRGKAKYLEDDSTILHIRGHGYGGTLEAPTPIKIFRSALQGPVGRQNHEARMWRRGTAIQQAIQFPQGISAEQTSEWKELYRSNYEGTSGETTLVVGGGAEIKPIGLTPADAQFAEMAKLTVHDAARIMAVPANLLGTQEERPVPNLEQDITAWLRFGLQPELDRIEAALEADEELFGSAQTYPRFDTQDFVRGDVQTEAQVLGTLVQQGVITADEARRRLWGGLEPLPGGLGAVPQMTPVGGAPNPIPAKAPMVVGSAEQNGGGA